MNSKIIPFFTAGVASLSLICAILALKSNENKEVVYDRASSSEEFYTINQDMLPSTVQTIARSQGQSFFTALFTGKDIPDTDADISIWAKSDNENFQNVLEDTSINLKLHYNREKSETLAQCAFIENAKETLAITANINCDTAGVYIPQIDENYYVLNTEDFKYGFESVTGLSFSEDNALESNEESGDGKSNEDADFAEIFKIMMGIVTDDNVQIETGSSISLKHFEEVLPGTVYTCSPKADDYEQMLCDLADYMSTHESARNRVHNLLDNIAQSNAQIENIEKLITNEDNELKDNAKAIADILDDSDFNWSVASSDDGTGKVLNISFDYNNVEIKLCKEESSNDGSYMSINLDGSYISIMSLQDDNMHDESSFLGLPYGKITIAAGDETRSSEVVLTTTSTDDNLMDETVVEFYGGAGMGNVELHIEAQKSCSAQVPEVTDEYQKDMTTATSQEVHDLFKIYHNGIAAALLSSKLLGYII